MSLYVRSVLDNIYYANGLFEICVKRQQFVNKIGAKVVMGHIFEVLFNALALHNFLSFI